MAGFWHLSSTMMFDELGVPAPGAQAYFYAASVLDQLTVYKDSALTVPWNQPVSADGFGRMPNVYLDDSAASYYRFRVTSAEGVELIALASIPVNAGSGGGGGGSGVDPTTVLNTGDCWWSPIQGVRAGAVRMNARTIGSATSGATERANADCNALFLFLWTNLTDAVCPVSTGRGASAAADWAANKNIGLPDMRGREALGLTAMGGLASGRLGNTYAGTGDTAGATYGVDGFLLASGQMPAHTHAVGTLVTGIESATHTHTVPGQGAQPTQGGATYTGYKDSGAGVLTGIENASHTHPITGATASTGGGTVTPVVGPSMVGTWFIKL